MQKDQDNKTFDLFAAPSFGTNAREMARNTDPDTSHEAAEKVDAARLERMVYEVICMYPSGCTSDQIMRHFPSHGVQTISPRYAPLLRKGFVYDTGERRLGNLGRPQRVLKKVETS
jgi:hypothetical protein